MGIMVSCGTIGRFSYLIISYGSSMDAEGMYKYLFWFQISRKTLSWDRRHSARNHRLSAPIMMDVSQCVRDVLVSMFKYKCGIALMISITVLSEESTITVPHWQSLIDIKCIALLVVVQYPHVDAGIYIINNICLKWTLRISNYTVGLV